MEVLKLVCFKLNQADIPYMLTGSFASNFYTVPRMTRDADIVIELQGPNIKKLFQIFKNDFYFEENSITDAIVNQSMFNIIHNNSVFKIDFIIRKDTIYRDLEFQRKRQIQFENDQVWIVSPEDLIISKLFWAKDSFSEMQLQDIRNLMTSVENLDMDYIKKWVQKLGLNDIFDRI